jgi:hypothetical protein
MSKGKLLLTFFINYYIHNCNVAFGIADKGAAIESGNRVENCRVIRNIY